MNEITPSTPPTTPIPFIPLYDHILILPDKPAETHGDSGIVIPEVHRNPVPMGVVVATGEGHLCTAMYGRLFYTEMGERKPLPNDMPRCHVEPLRIKVGDRVLYSKHSGTELRLSPDPKAQHYFLLKEAEILGIIKA
jgi:co-chaperonin GroES (HSP10)